MWNQVDISHMFPYFLYRKPQKLCSHSSWAESSPHSTPTMSQSENKATSLP